MKPQKADIWWEWTRILWPWSSTLSVRPILIIFYYIRGLISDGCLLCVASATREIKFPFKHTWQLAPSPYTHTQFFESAHQEVSSSLKLKHDINHQNVFNDALIHKYGTCTSSVVLYSTFIANFYQQKSRCLSFLLIFYTQTAAHVHIYWCCKLNEARIWTTNVFN